MRYLASLLALTFYSLFCFSQGEGNNWYFGNYSGLSFSTNPPSVLNNGHLTTGEGSASVSGKDGALVFYTEGSKVWDANHNLMPNGTGLFGSGSSTQSAVICPKPGTYNYSKKRYDGYFIVTIAAVVGPGGVRFTEVNMNLNGGLGDVVSTNKNVHLFGTSTMEGANVAKHANGCDFWIIGKEIGNNNVRAYHVSNSGVNLVPIISVAASPGVQSTGSIKVSPNSKLVSIVNGSSPNIEIFDFNNSNGVLTTKFTETLGGNSYSSEFSSNNKVFYFTGLNNPNIYQYDLTATTQAAFSASQTIIGTTANTYSYRMCGLQLAPNGKIYAALTGQTRLGVINDPNILGVGCNYDDNGQTIVGVNSFSNTNMSSNLGLPAFPSFFVKEPVVINSSYLCFNDETKFKLSDTTDMNSVDWFWTPVGSSFPPLSSSTDWEPTVQYVTPGDYAVLSVAYFPCFTDSIYDTITITAVNDVNLGNDTVLCNGANITLDAGSGYDYYTWHNGDDSQTFLADTTGQYIIEVANIGENLVFNGDFELGNVGFSSEYNYVASGAPPQGSYAIKNNSNTWGGNCFDHSSGSGLMMEVDAACGSNGIPGGAKLWCQSIEVSPNTDYLFSVWAANAASGGPSTANIGFFIDDVQVGSTVETTNVPCDWQGINQTWNSSSNTNVEICIKELTLICSGADFIIDDIFFAPLCKTSDTINVVVGENPVAQFSLIDSCEYEAVVYADESMITLPETISTWSWDIDNDGIEDYNTQNPSHTFTAGSYTTKLTVTSTLGCTKDTTMPVLVYPKPTANFTFQSDCLYDSLLFVDASTVLGDIIAGHVWNFGESPTPPAQSIASTPYYTYSSAGTYNVSEIVATANGCLDTITQQIEVYEVPIASYITSNICQDITAEFTDQSSIVSGTIDNYEWDFGDATSGMNQNETHNYTADGTYTVQFIVTSDNDCKDTLEQDVIIYPVPVADFTMADDCLEESIPFTDNSTINAPGVISQWAWDFDDLSNPSSDQSPIHLYQDPGTYNVTLNVVSGNNCSNSIQQSVTVYPLPQVSFVASEICVNEPPTTFTNTSVISSGTNVNYLWSFGDINASTSLQESPTFNYGVHGNYEVTLGVVSDKGCTSLLIDTIKVKHKPTALYTQDTTGGCAPICINFISQSEDSIGIAAWDWQFENTLGEGSNKFEGYCYETAGTFDVKLIVQNTEGCYDTIESLGLINTFDFPVAEFELTPEVTTVDEPTITFTNLSTDEETWMWDFADGELDSINYDPTHVYADTGNYIVELIAYSANGCSTKIYHEVIVLPIENVFVPTAFSPNGDGENDVLYVRGYLNGLYFSVYDRWGKKVFETNNEAAGWDGLINGKPAMEGVYMWYLQTSFNGEPKKFKGDVSLMR